MHLLNARICLNFNESEMESQFIIDSEFGWIKHMCMWMTSVHSLIYDAQRSGAIFWTKVLGALTIHEPLGSLYTGNKKNIQWLVLNCFIKLHSFMIVIVCCPCQPCPQLSDSVLSIRKCITLVTNTQSMKYSIPSSTIPTQSSSMQQKKKKGEGMWMLKWIMYSFCFWLWSKIRLKQACLLQVSRNCKMFFFNLNEAVYLFFKKTQNS